MAGSASLYNFKSHIVDFTPTLDTNEYAQNDVLFDFQAVTIPALSQKNPLRGTINNITLLDKDDQGNQISLFVSDDSSASLGTANGAVSITDAHAATILGIIDTGDTYEDLVGSQIVQPSAFSPIAFETDNETLYIGGVLRGAATPTHTASGITIRLHLTIE